MLFSFLFGRSTSPARPAAAARRPAPSRLRVEALEDRAAPASLGLESSLLPFGLTASPTTLDAIDNNGEAMKVLRGLNDDPHDPHTVPWVLLAEGSISATPAGLVASWSGTSNLIGRYTASATLNIAADGQGISGSGKDQAANGDEIYFTYTGRFASPIGTVASNPFRGTAVVTGGTGRFAGASGTVDLLGTLQADNTVQFAHFGRLNR